MVFGEKALKEKCLFEKNGTKDMRSRTERKSADEEVKDGLVEFLFFLLLVLLFEISPVVDGQRENETKKKEKRIEGWKKYFRRVWFNPSVS